MKQHKIASKFFLMIPMVCCFSCSQFNPLKYFESSEETHTHTFSKEYFSDETKHWQNATCEHTELVQNLANHTFVDGVCSVCDYVKDTIHEHKFSDVYSFDLSSHWQAAICEHTELTKNFGLHSFVNGYCSVCGMEEPSPAHIHTFNTEYSYDETSHWQAATCEHTTLTQNLGTHNFVNGFCTLCNMPEPAPGPEPHIHTFNTEYTYDEISHWQTATCEHSELTQNLGSHNFVNGFCTICGFEEPLPPHTHTFNIEYTHDETSHWQAATCEHSELTQNLGSHNFVNGVCEICGYIDPHSIVTYDEEADSLDGVDALDLSHLYNAFSLIGKNYTLTNRSHFTDSALALYNKDYKEEFSQQTTRLVNEKYLYTYSNDETYSLYNQYNKLYLFDEGGVSLDYPNTNLLDVELYEPSKGLNDESVPFMLDNIDESYLNTHAFKRSSKYKYICEDETVINDFLELCCPYLKNEGYYMTYRKVSIEVDNYDAITRIRIYTSPTQKAKLMNNYTNEDYDNWYLMFNESIVKDIGKTSIKALET